MAKYAEKHNVINFRTCENAVFLGLQSLVKVRNFLIQPKDKVLEHLNTLCCLFLSHPGFAGLLEYPTFISSPTLTLVLCLRWFHLNLFFLQNANFI